MIWSHRAALPVLLAVVTVLGTCLVIDSAAGVEPVRPLVEQVEKAAPKLAKAPTFGPTRAAAGEPVVVTGHLRVKRRAKIQLQRRHGGRWTSVARGVAGKRGAYRFRIAAPTASASYRVVSGHVRSRGRTLAVLPQSGSIALPSTGVASATGSVVATFGPARPGRSVALQRLDGGRWWEVGRATQDAGGRASLPVPLDLETAATYRAVASTWRGAAAVTTPSAVLDVRPTPARITSPSSDAVLSATTAVRVDPHDVPEVTRVAVFAGAAWSREAIRQPDGTWLAHVDTSELPNGRTDLSARVWTTHGNRLVPSVRVRVANPSSSSTSLDDGFVLDTVAGGLALPTSFAVIDEHRTLVTEKKGLVRLVVDGTLRKTPVLDLTAAVGDWWDQGLIGVALDPGFDDNGWFYLTYVLERDAADLAADATGDMHSQRLVRYTFADGVADPASAHVVLGGVRGPACFDHPTADDCLPVQGGAHTIDDLLFLPDGSLLVSVGDGVMNYHDRSAATRAQDLDVLAGKILRVDPSTGHGYADNPFYDGDPSSNRSRVWAYGFRNPFRMTAAPDGDVYLADVGENTQEELDLLEAGGNYGWPCREGRDVANPLLLSGCEAILGGTVPTVEPVFVYDHDRAGSVTGGVFYSGDAYPAAYDGRYFFADYSFGVIWQIDLGADEPADTFAPFANPPAPGGAVKFAIGPDGNVWYLSVTTGELRRIVYDPDGTVCPSDHFRGEYFSSRHPAPGTQPVLVTCDTSLPAGPGLTAPPYVAGTDGFSVRWTGHPALTGGRYAVSAASAGDLEVRVDGERVADGGTFQVTQSGTADATPEIVVTLSSATSADARFAATYTRTGTPPTVEIGGLTPGALLAPGSTRAWTVSASVRGSAIPPGDLESSVTLLHYGSATPHSHPSATISGDRGEFTFAQDHAPGKTVFRIDARAVGADGSVGVADPVYVCLVGSEVGLCGH